MKEVKIAGLMQVKDYDNECHAFDTLKELGDYTIILDNNSTTSFPFTGKCDEYISLKHSQLWNCGANKILLMYRAFVAGYEWVIHWDDDIIPNAELNRAAVSDAVLYLQDKNVDMGLVKRYDLWENWRQYRIDGVFCNKFFPLIQRNIFCRTDLNFKEPSKIRLHSRQPLKDKNLENQLITSFVVYHTGMKTRQKREARWNMYQREDKNLEFQNNYDYILEENGVKLQTVPFDDWETIYNKTKQLV